MFLLVSRTLLPSTFLWFSLRGLKWVWDSIFLLNIHNTFLFGIRYTLLVLSAGWSRLARLLILDCLEHKKLLFIFYAFYLFRIGKTFQVFADDDGLSLVIAYCVLINAWEALVLINLRLLNMERCHCFRRVFNFTWLIRFYVTLLKTCSILVVSKRAWILQVLQEILLVPYWTHWVTSPQYVTWVFIISHFNLAWRWALMHCCFTLSTFISKR